MARLIANRGLVALVVAGGLSGIGDWLYLTALPVLVFLRTGDPVLVGLVAAGRLLPFLVLSVPAGIAADRWPRRRILLVTESVRCLAMVAGAALCVVDGPVVAILGVAMIAAAAGTFSMPAQGSLIPELARSDDELGLANSLDATLDGVASILGPAIAAVLILVGGLAVAFVINAVTFLVILIVLRRLPVHGGPAGSVSASPSDHDRSLSDDGAGAAIGEPLAWRTLVRRIARPIAMDAAVSLTASMLVVLPVVVAVDAMHMDASFGAALATAAGLGALAGGAGSALFAGRRWRLGLTGGVILTVVGLLGLGVAVPLAALGGIALTSAAVTVLDTMDRTWIQRLTASGGTGRAFGLVNGLAAMWMVAGSLVPMTLVAVVGLGGAVLAVAATVAALGVLALWPADGRKALRPESQLL